MEKIKLKFMSSTRLSGLKDRGVGRSPFLLPRTYPGAIRKKFSCRFLFLTDKILSLQLVNNKKHFHQSIKTFTS